MKKKSLLVWDQFRAHKTEKVKEELQELNTTQAVIPGGLKSLLQPLDVVLNKPLKDKMRKLWISWMSSDQHEYTTQALGATYTQIIGFSPVFDGSSRGAACTRVQPTHE